jgi:hypothetical protein
MFPPDKDQYRYNRMVLKYDMPWEPWFHASVWIATLLVILVGEKGVLPPIDGIDWCWLYFLLVSPVIGFSSVWALEHSESGTVRYYAVWGRMISDSGLSLGIILYQLDRFLAHDALEAIGLGHNVIPNVVLMAATWFTLTLVKRDIDFLADSEVLADQIYRRGDDEL